MDKKILIMGAIALAILMTGCIDEKPDGGVTPSNVTQAAEPVVKDSAEAIDLVKEKHPELAGVEVCRFLDDTCNHSIIVNEIPDAWNLTFWKRSKDCEDQCWVKHYFPFFVYENGSLARGEEYKELKLAWGFDPEVEIDVEENESFLIREGQIVKGKIMGYNATMKYVKTHSSRLLKIEEFPSNAYKDIFNITFDCSSGVCKYDLDIYIVCPNDFCEITRFEVKTINWAVNNSEVISLHNSTDAPAIYVRVYKWKKWTPIVPGPIYFDIEVGEIRNESIYGVAKSIHELENRMLHNITINYISSSPNQIFEVIIDSKRERFEVDINTELLSVDGVEKGDTCRESKGYFGGRCCFYKWQKENLLFTVTPALWTRNTWNESVPSCETWNTTKLHFEISY